MHSDVSIALFLLIWATAKVNSRACPNVTIKKRRRNPKKPKYLRGLEHDGCKTSTKSKKNKKTKTFQRLRSTMCFFAVAHFQSLKCFGFFGFRRRFLTIMLKPSQIFWFLLDFADVFSIPTFEHAQLLTFAVTQSADMPF